jgi:hypothetical protein
VGKERPCPCGGIFKDILAPAFADGEQLIDREMPARIREGVLWQVKGLQV